RAENMVENTQNADVFVEVSGILSACATNLLKVAGDLRLMSSGPDAGLGEITLPPVQAGSSIMPGKVNPVIPEAVSQAALSVIGHHAVIAQACGMGSLELNPFLPLVADCLLHSLQLLDNGCTLLAERCVQGISVNRQRCRSAVNGATATITALIDVLGYETAEAVLRESQTTNQSLRDVVIRRGYLTGEAFDETISADAVIRLGS
ncbi:MAG: lyase family protein, partial [Sedimentisphaerales bacterium]|nr:lyase family protein [Sedimentisphaerales bacterium]